MSINRADLVTLAVLALVPMAEPIALFLEKVFGL